MMDKDQVIERLCQLAAKVGKERFESNHPYDCFCRLAKEPPFGRYQFSERILEFIEDAVQTALDDRLTAVEITQKLRNLSE